MVSVAPSRAGRAWRHPARGRGRSWVLVACAVLLFGVAVSAVGALEWRAEESNRATQAFRSTATDVTNALSILLLRDASFISTVRGVLTIESNVSPSRFNTWYSTLQDARGQVGNIGSAVIESVPARQLTPFLRRRNSDPAFRAFAPVPAPVARAHKSRYCLISAIDKAPFDSSIKVVMQQDWCDPGTAVGSFEAPLLSAATDTGHMLVISYTIGSPTTVLEAALYRRGAPLATVTQRRAAVIGWILNTLDVPALIRAAIPTHSGLTVGLYHQNPQSLLGTVTAAPTLAVPAARLSRGTPKRAPELIGQLGPTPPRGPLQMSTPESTDGTWMIRVRGTSSISGLSADAQGALVLAAGSIVSVLLFVLVMVLARAREHALGVVAQKTGQLRHQALHDALTGLPNRVLALDRAEQMLARARRNSTPVAALYVDIDAFKQINDTFGHAAGDAFLRIVAARLRSVVRDSDTAARLAGDEFIILLDSTPTDTACEFVAQRLLDVLREPYDLNDTIGRQLSLTASIGIAYGPRETAEELLADADIALYAAKGAGKNRYVTFQSEMQTAVQDRLTLQMDLADAIDADELFLLYQPIFDLHTERMIATEALLRWRHPSRGSSPQISSSRSPRTVG